MEKMRKVIVLLASFMTFIVILVGCKSQQDSYKQLLQIVKNTNEAIENTKASKQIPWWDNNCIWDSCGISNNCVYFYVHEQSGNERLYSGIPEKTRKAEFLFDIIYSEDLWKQIQWFKDANVGIALRITNANIDDVIVSSEEVQGWNFNDKVGNAKEFLAALIEEENHKISGAEEGCVEMTFDGTTVTYKFLCGESDVEAKIDNMDTFKEELEIKYNDQKLHMNSVYTNASFDIDNMKKHANANSMYIYKSKESDKTFYYKVSAFGKLLECNSIQ